MKKTHYNFPVEFRELTADSGIKVSNRQAVVRTDSNVAIGVVSKKYALVPHAEVVEGFREALKGHKVNESIRTTHNGARMHLELMLPDVRVDIGGGDEVALRLVVENSYDGSHKLQIIFGALRLVCSNGMVIGRKFLSLNRRHIGTVGVDVEMVRKQVEMLTELFKKELPTMKEMNTTRLVPAPAEFFDPKTLHIPAYLTKIAAKNYVDAKGKTVWDAYNATTAAITHSMKKDSPESVISMGRHAWSAATSLIK